MKCEICLKSDLLEHYPKLELAYCAYCHSFYSELNHSNEQAIMSILAAEATGNFKGYNDNEFHNTGLETLLAAVKLNLASNNNLLDIGCFDGRFIHFANKMGFRGYGLERQNEMVAFCQSNNLRVFQGVFPVEVPPQLTDLKFKIISSLESIYYWRDLNRCIKKIAGLLDENGYFLIKLNQGTSLYYRNHTFAERVHDFNVMLNVKALKILLRRHNFKCIACKPYSVFWDDRIYHEKNKLRLGYFRLRRKIFTEFLLKLKLVKYWDKVILLYQKID